MRNWTIGLGPVLGLATAASIGAAGYGSAPAIVAFVAVVCVVWWIFEPIPIPATSLLPVAVLPLLGVITPGAAAAAFGSPIVLLLMGGFMLSKAMEKSGSHRRIALAMVALFGTRSGLGLVLGFMTASALLSMWISNTATTLMLLPVVLAVLQASEDRERLAAPLLLGVAYAASVGGIGTPIGTPPNLIFMQIYEETTGGSIGFVEWMHWGLPVVVTMVPAMAFILSRGIRGEVSVVLPEVGAWRSEEKRVLLVFGLTALAWITRGEPFGGWSTWFGLPQANDASVALVSVIVLFLFPNGHGGRLLDWDKAVEIPWGVLLLFGGGICLAKGFVDSGLSGLMGSLFTQLQGVPTYLLILSIALVVTFMTETTSNTASTTLLMPVLAAAAAGIGVEPRLLMVPAAMSASCAFMLPVATAPNSVVYGSGLISTSRMAREGIWMNLVGAGIISVVCYLLLS